MKITHTDIWKFSIPMHPFTIATGTMHFAQNVFIRIHTEEGLYGVGECSAFPVITGETQATCFEMAREFATIWKGRDASNIDERMEELHAAAAFNSTIKSAFDIALFDLAAKYAGQPLYHFLGGKQKPMETDLTIGIDSPEKMQAMARSFLEKGARIIKVKLGREPEIDIRRIKMIREVAGPDVLLRIDANQGWNYENAMKALKGMQDLAIQFCEQPMRTHNDGLLPALRKNVDVKIMADESVYDHYDAIRLINMNACDYVNIKFAKSGGIREAIRINETCASHGISCMMGGMLESRIALSAFAHFAMAHDNVIFYDMDTCLLGHKTDPTTGGVKYNGFNVEVPETPGIGADADDVFLGGCVRITV